MTPTRTEEITVTNAPTVPGQPDGIDDDSSDFPEPARAAERVLKYVAAFGDGLYDVQDGAPLYGRDLEAICRAVLATPTPVPSPATA